MRKEMKSRRCILAIVASLSALASFTGCFGDDEEKQSTCISDTECNYPKEVCLNAVCVPNKNYTPQEEVEFPQVTLSVSYGQYLNYLTIQNWYTLIPEVPNTSGSGRGELVVMLCDENDPTCVNPRHVRALTKEEVEQDGGQNKLIQPSFGPQLSLYDLPAGKWNMMIFEDTASSAAGGYSWKDTLPLCKKGVDDWGCLVSEVDRMLVAKQDYDDYTSKTKTEWGIYPQPSSILIDIPEKCSSSSCTRDLGKQLLAHYHERNISVDYQPENGYLAVGTAGGLRIVDLSTEKKPTVVESYNNMFDFILVDENDEQIAGVPCGLIDGGDEKTVWVIFQMEASSEPNIAVPFDVQKREQIGNKHVILKNSTTNKNICRGIVKDGKMFVWGRYQGLPGNGYVQFAKSLEDVLNNTANIESNNCETYAEQGHCSVSHDIAYLNGTDSLVVWHDTMYSIQGMLNAEQKPKGSNGGMCAGAYDLCVFKTDTRGDYLTPISNKDDATTFLEGGAYDATVTDSDGTRECVVNDYNINVPALALVEKSDTEAWLIASKCIQVVAWKLTYDPDTHEITEEKMKLSKVPGQNYIDTSRYGVYIHDWAMSPDGATLYGMPSGKSTTMLYVKQGMSDKRAASNRLLGLVLDLTDEYPYVSAATQFNRNIDDFEGTAGDSNPKSPAIDPGLDIQQHWYLQYFLELKDTLQGQTTTFRPQRPLIVASQNTLWLTRVGNGSIAGGTDGNGTLGHYRDIAAYDLKEARSILWPHLNETYYHPYSGSTAIDRPSGFPLDPKKFNTVNTMGIVYVPKK